MVLHISHGAVPPANNKKRHIMKMRMHSVRKDKGTAVGRLAVMMSSQSAVHKEMTDASYLPKPKDVFPFWVPREFVIPDLAYIAALDWLDLDETGHVNLNGRGVLTKPEACMALHWLHIPKVDMFAEEVEKLGNGDLRWEDIKLVWTRMGQGTRKLTVWEQIYCVFDNPECCLLAKIVSNFIMLCILGSTLSMVLESLPSMQSQSCPTCEPEVSEPTLAVIEVFCIMVFTVEYVIRLGERYSDRPAPSSH